jgi:hypothetical protein
LRQGDATVGPKCWAKQQNNPKAVGFRVGRVAAYKIKRRPRPSGPWTDAGMAIESEITLSGQSRGEELEYRIIAVNKSGEGEPSNTVMAVL